MKITSLTVRNVGIIADAKIPINQPLIVFYGEIKMGKSTLLSAVKWCLGGTFPSDIIRHGEKEASVEMEFDGGVITRSWYRTKATDEKPSETKARPVQFVRAGKPVANPVAELKRLANPFLLDQDFLRNKTELERKTYFMELFAVDTSALDTELFNAARKAQDLRAKLTGYGDIDLTEVKPIDTAALRQELAQVRQQHQDKVAEWQKEQGKIQQEHRETLQSVERVNEAIRLRHSTFDRSVQVSDALVIEISRLEKALETARFNLKTALDWQKEHTKEKLTVAPAAPVETPMPTAPDTSALEAKLQAAVGQNVRAEQYQKNLQRDSARKMDETALKAIEDRQRQIKKEKIAALAKINENCGVKDLAFDEDGTFTFEGTAAGMLSTSQIMRLSSALSALYPEGLSLELVDRAESLGRSIFDYVNYAKGRSVSVLATVVGQKPANVPTEVGVWVVKDGVIMKDEEETK